MELALVLVKQTLHILMNRSRIAHAVPDDRFSSPRQYLEMKYISRRAIEIDGQRDQSRTREMSLPLSEENKEKGDNEGTRTNFIQHIMMELAIPNKLDALAFAVFNIVYIIFNLIYFSPFEMYVVE